MVIIILAIVLVVIICEVRERMAERKHLANVVKLILERREAIIMEKLATSTDSSGISSKFLQ